MTDAELQFELDRLRRGDAAAFESLYRELGTPVYTVLLRIVRDRFLAEDLFQDFFTALYQKPPAEDVRKPRAYLFQTARNLALDALRRRRETAPLEEAALRAAAPETGPETLDLAAAIDRLELSERQAVTLHLNAGLRFREIAAITGEPLGTVYARYRKAIEKLRAYMEMEMNEK